LQFEQVGDAGEFKLHLLQNLPVEKSGYVYIYVSNASTNIPVYFHNLQVTHIRGPILEETHHYPFGLTMAGISSKAAGYLENTKNKFQNQEFNEDLGVDMYEFKYRMDDPEIGRFWQVDPLANDYVHNSTYAFSENHVTTDIELEGLERVSINDQKKMRAAEKNEIARMAQTLKSMPHFYLKADPRTIVDKTKFNLPLKFGEKGKPYDSYNITGGNRIEESDWQPTNKHTDPVKIVFGMLAVSVEKPEADDILSFGYLILHLGKESTEKNEEGANSSSEPVYEPGAIIPLTDHYYDGGNFGENDTSVRAGSDGKIKDTIITSGGKAIRDGQPAEIVKPRKI
jgi:RHS repeat-associated protein